MAEIDIDDIERVPGIEIFTGNKLRLDIEYIAQLKPRMCMAHIDNYISRPANKLFLITGLRSTGKTVLQKQAINRLSQADFDASVRLNIADGCDIEFSEVIDLCFFLYEKGFQWFFIDEATEASNFATEINRLADTLACYGCHILLTGAKSLAMSLARRHIEGRYEEIHTTVIPYCEWNALLGHHQDNGFLDYIRYGGILDSVGFPASHAYAAHQKYLLVNTHSIEYYTYSSIALNLQNSIAKYA